MRSHLQVVLFSVFFALCFSLTCSAQIPVPSASPIAAASPAPAPSATPVASSSVPSAPSASAAPVVVAAPAAPPLWAQDILVEAAKLPIVGPYVSQAILYAGILAGILTAIVACVLTILSLLSGVAGISGLSGVAASLQNFQSGQVMYWLKYLSMFNAQKSSTPAASASVTSTPAAQS